MKPGETSAVEAGTAAETYYTISFFTYARPYHNFFGLAEFLAESTTRLFAARPHWGKLFSMPPAELKSIYKKLPDFIQLSKKYDPHGKFRNEFLSANIFSG